jgi:hypothetical protein
MPRIAHYAPHVINFLVTLRQSETAAMSSKIKSQTLTASAKRSVVGHVRVFRVEAMHLDRMQE